VESLKRMLPMALAVACLATFAGNADAGAAEVLADHSLKSFDGRTMKLSSLRGEIVVVNFWASWCKPCRKELSVMEQWHAAWVDRGARVVAISIDRDLRNAQRFVEDNDFALDFYHDGPEGLARELDLPSLPCTFLIDQKGKVVRVIESSSTEDLALIYSNVQTLLADGVARRTNASLNAAEGGN